MLRIGPAKKVSIYLNEDTVATTGFLYSQIFSFLLAKGIAGATMVRPEAGFGSHHRVHDSEHGLGFSEHLPLRIEFVDSADAVEALMPELCAMVTDGLIEAHDTFVYKAASQERAV